MAQLQPSTDPGNLATQVELNTKDIATIMGELNRGIDPTGIARRAILASQIKVMSYQPAPFKLHAGATLASGSYATVVVNFQNNGLTNAAGQTFLPVPYLDLFVDPPVTSSTSAIYGSSGAYVYPDGASVTSAMQNLTFVCYLRNSTPGTNSDVVSYVIQIRNSDASAHAYWVSFQLLLPADGNLNTGNTARFLS